MAPHKKNSKANRTDWVTPQYIIDALGHFDLDPCCSSIMPWRTAATMIRQPSDGLAIKWFGRVWLNPPYGNAQNVWLKRLKEHGNGIALIPASTETLNRFRRYIWNGGADGICFIYGRVKFHLPDGSIPKYGINQACCLAAFGENNFSALLKCLGVCRWLKDLESPCAKV